LKTGPSPVLSAAQPILSFRFLPSKPRISAMKERNALVVISA
jgi:hypothetical protein